MQRIPVLPTSNIALDILNGKDELLDFDDYLNGKKIFFLLSLFNSYSFFFFQKRS